MKLYDVCVMSSVNGHVQHISTIAYNKPFTLAKWLTTSVIPPLFGIPVPNGMNPIQYLINKRNEKSKRVQVRKKNVC